MANPDPALAELRAAAEAAATPAERAHALNQLAEQLEKQGQYAESLAAAERAHTLAKQAKEPTAEAKALRLQGVAHWRRGSYTDIPPKKSIGSYEGVACRRSNSAGVL